MRMARWTEESARTAQLWWTYSHQHSAASVMTAGLGRGPYLSATYFRRLPCLRVGYGAKPFGAHLLQQLPRGPSCRAGR